MTEDVQAFIANTAGYSERIRKLRTKIAEDAKSADAAYSKKRASGKSALKKLEQDADEAADAFGSAVRDAGDALCRGYVSAAEKELSSYLDKYGINRELPSAASSFEDAVAKMRGALEKYGRLTGSDKAALSARAEQEKLEYEKSAASAKAATERELHNLIEGFKKEYFALNRKCVSDYTLDDEMPQTSDAVPESTVIGNILVPSGGELASVLSSGTLRLPAILDIRRAGNIMINLRRGDSDADEIERFDDDIENLITGVALRYLESFPVGSMRAGIFSSSYTSQQKLAAMFGALRTGKLTIDPQASAQSALASLLENVEMRCTDINDKMLESGCVDIYEMYEKNTSFPFQLIIVYDVLRSITDDNLRELYSCVKSFYSCGVRLIIADDFDEDSYPHRTDTFYKYLSLLRGKCSEFTFDGSEIRDAAGHKAELVHVGENVGRQYVYNFCKQYCEGIGKNKESVSYEQIGFGKDTTGSRDTISIPIGLDKPDIWHIDFSCRNDPPIANLIIGVPGTGKSTLIDAMILCGSIKYSPDELIFYLLDFKDGISSSAYTREDCRIPHVKVVSQGNKPEEAEIILSNIFKESRARNEKFKQLGRECGNPIKDISEYNEAAESLGMRTMPRLIIVIDECQYLFEDESLAKQCEDVVRKCRSQGIHLVLATQSLSFKMRSTIKFVDGRYCFEIATEDADALLDRKYAQTVSKEVPKGSFMALASNDSGRTCRKIKIAYDNMPEYAQKIRDKWSDYPIDIVEVGDTSPYIVRAEEFAEKFAPVIGGAAKGEIVVPLGEDYTDHSVSAITFRSEKQSALLLVGTDPGISGGLCASVLLSASREGAAVYAADASRSRPLVRLGKALGGTRVTDESGYADMLAEICTLYNERSRDLRAEYAPVVFIVFAAQNIREFIEDTPVTKRTDDVPSAADTDAEDLMSFYGSLKNRPRDDGSPAVTGKASLLHLMSNAYKANIFVCLALDSVSITYNGDAVLGYTQKNILRGCNFKVLLPRVTDDVRTVMDDSFKDKMARGLGDGLALLCEYGQDYGKFRPIRIEE